MYANINRTYRVGLPGLANYLPRAQFLRIDNDISESETNPMNFSQIMVFNKLGENVAQNARVTVNSTSTETGYSAASTVVSGDPFGSTKWRAGGIGTDEYLEIDFGGIHDIEYMIFINDTSSTDRARGAMRLMSTLKSPSGDVTFADNPFDNTRIQYVPYCLDGTPARYVAIRPPAAGGYISLRQVLVFGIDGDLISSVARTYTPVTVERLPFTFVNGTDTAQVTNCQPKSDELDRLNADLDKYNRQREPIIDSIKTQQSNYTSALDYFAEQYSLTIAALDALITEVTQSISTAGGVCNTGSIFSTDISVFLGGNAQAYTDVINSAKNATPNTVMQQAARIMKEYLQTVIKPAYDNLAAKRTATIQDSLFTVATSLPDGQVSSTADAITKFASSDYANSDAYKRVSSFFNLITADDFKNRDCYKDYQEKFTNAMKKVTGIIPLVRGASISRIDAYTTSQFKLGEVLTSIQTTQTKIDDLLLKPRGNLNSFTDTQSGRTLVNGSIAPSNIWTSQTNAADGYWVLDLGTDREIGAVMLYNVDDQTLASRIVGLRVQLYKNDGCMSGTFTVSNRDDFIPISFLNSIPQRAFNSGATPFDSFYDAYEAQQLTDTNETIPQEDYTPVKAGYELGQFDAEIKEVAWDSDNKEQPQKDIVWGYISMNASQSLAYKAYMNAMNNAGAYGIDGTSSGTVNPPVYHSPVFRQDFNDKTTAGLTQTFDALLQNGVAEQLENVIEQRLNTRAVTYNRFGLPTSVRTVATKPVGAAARGALPGRVGVRGRSLVMRSMFSRAQTRLAQQAAQKAAQVAVSRGIGAGLTAAGTVQVAAGTATANPALVADGSRQIGLGTLIIIFITIIDIVAAILQATLAPYFDTIWEGQGACPEGYVIWEDHIGDTYNTIIGMLPLTSILDIFKDYYCWSWMKFPTAKLKEAVKYPAWLNDRTLSLIYHDWDDGVNNYEPRGSKRGDPGYLLPESHLDVAPPKIINGYWADFSKPSMLKAMADFYNDKSRNNPFFIEDGRIEYKLITRILGVIASSEFSCDVRCEMKTVRHDPITGDGYEEDFGCKYDAADFPSFAGETDCFRRFYFTRVGDEKVGEFTVTACTNADYTAPDAMIQSYGPLPDETSDTPPLIQSIPKVFEPQWIRQRPPYNTRAMGANLLTALVPIAGGLATGYAVARFGGGRALRSREKDRTGIARALESQQQRGKPVQTYTPTNSPATLSSTAARDATLRERVNMASGFAGAIVGAGLGTAIGMQNLADPNGPFMRGLGEREADTNIYYKIQPPNETQTRFIYTYKSPDWFINMGPIVEQGNGYRPTIDLCKSFVTSESYCADKRIVKQFKEEYERVNPTKHIRTIEAIEPRVAVHDLSNNGCWYKFKEVSFDKNTNTEGTTETVAESVLTNTQVDPNTCIFIPDGIVPSSQYKIREVVFNPGSGKPIKKYYPTRLIPSELAGKTVDANNNPIVPTSYPTRYPKKPFRVPRGLPSCTLGASATCDLPNRTCPTRKCQDSAQVAALVGQFNSTYADRKILKVLRGWTPEPNICEYEVEMLRVLPTVEGFSTTRPLDLNSPTPPITLTPVAGPTGPSGPTGATPTLKQTYRAGISQGNQPPPGATVMARESLRMRVSAEPSANCIFNLESDESNTINSGKYVTMKYKKEEYGYDVSGGMANFDEDLFKLEGGPTQEENQGDTSLYSTASTLLTRIKSLFSSSYETSVERPLKESNQILQGVVAKGLSTQGFPGCPTATCTSGQLLGAFQTEFDRVNYRLKGLSVETKRVNRILRAVKTGPTSCDILAEVKREYRETMIKRAAYSDSLLELYRVNFTNTGNCNFAVSSATGSIVPLPSTDIKANVALQSPEAAITPPFSCSINCRQPSYLTELKRGVETARSGIVVSAVLASLNTNADTCEYLISDDKENTFVATMKFNQTPSAPCTFTPRQPVSVFNTREVDYVFIKGEQVPFLNGERVEAPVLDKFSTDMDPADLNADIDITVKVF